MNDKIMGMDPLMFSVCLIIILCCFSCCIGEHFTGGVTEFFENQVPKMARQYKLAYKELFGSGCGNCASHDNNKEGCNAHSACQYDESTSKCLEKMAHCGGCEGKSESECTGSCIWNGTKCVHP